MTLHKRLRAFAALAALALVLSACGNDDDATEEPTDEATETAQELNITAVNYSFGDVPATVEAGTRLTLTNAAEDEAHELVLFRIVDGEERPLSEILALPEEEAQTLTTFQGVAFAFPGEETSYPEGDTTVNEAGRYAIVCFIPVGGDIAKMKEALANRDEEAAEPPDLGDGPPHFTQGMAAEFTVS